MSRLKNLGRFYSWLIRGPKERRSWGGDAERIGLDLKNLRKSKSVTIGIGGPIDTYVLSNVTLLFEIQGKKFHLETLEEVDVIKPKRHVPELPFSILGMDILKKFKISFSNGTLEK